MKNAHGKLLNLQSGCTVACVAGSLQFGTCTPSRIWLALTCRIKTALSSFIWFSSLFKVDAAVFFFFLLMADFQPKNWLNCCFHFTHSIQSFGSEFSVMLHIFLLFIFSSFSLFYFFFFFSFNGEHFNKRDAKKAHTPK